MVVTTNLFLPSSPCYLQFHSQIVLSDILQLVCGGGQLLLELFS